MAKTKKKGKAGKTLAGAGVLAIIAALLGFDPFGWGIGLGGGAGTGTGSGNGETKQEQQKDDYLMKEDQMPTVIPPATATPVEAQKEENATIVQLEEVVVAVNKDKVLHNEAEVTAKELAEQLATEYADKKDNILVKITLEDAVYDTVEALKVALEDKGMKYEIAE